MKTKEEFNLSDKITFIVSDTSHINISDVKEFIRRLKEKLIIRCKEIKLWEADALMRIYHEEVNKLAGDDLK